MKEERKLSSTLGIIISLGILITSLLPFRLLYIAHSEYDPLINSIIIIKFIFQIIFWFYFFIKHRYFQTIYEKLHNHKIFLFLLLVSSIFYLLLWPILGVIWVVEVGDEALIRILQYYFYGFFVFGVLIGILKSVEE